MRIVVCVKAVPASTEVKMDPRTHTIVREGGAAVLNPFDMAALEIALQVAAARRAAGEEADVVLLSMGIPSTVELLRDGIARGADAAVLISDRACAGADTLATSYTLTCGIAHIERERGPVDLVLCGKMAVDGDTAQIGPELAGALGVPCVADVRAVERAEGELFGLWCGTDEGTALVEVELPAVFTVAKEAAQVRMPSIPGVRAAELAQIPVLTAAALAADPARVGLAGSPTQVVRSFVPERAQAAVVIPGDAAAQARALADLVEGSEA